MQPKCAYFTISIQYYKIEKKLQCTISSAEKNVRRLRHIEEQIRRQLVSPDSWRYRMNASACRNSLYTLKSCKMDFQWRTLKLGLTRMEKMLIEIPLEWKQNSIFVGNGTDSTKVYFVLHVRSISLLLYRSRQNQLTSQSNFKWHVCHKRFDPDNKLTTSSWLSNQLTIGYAVAYKKNSADFYEAFFSLEFAVIFNRCESECVLALSTKCTEFVNDFLKSSLWCTKGQKFYNRNI